MHVCLSAVCIHAGRQGVIWSRRESELLNYCGGKKGRQFIMQPANLFKMFRFEGKLMVNCPKVQMLMTVSKLLTPDLTLSSFRRWFGW